MQEYHGFAEGQASVTFELAFAIITVGLPLVGSLADAYGIAVGLVGPFLLTAVGFVTLLLAPGPAVTYAGVCIVGARLTWEGPLQAKFIAQFGRHERGSGFGMARSVYVLLGSVGNVAMGTLTEISGWVVVYGVVAALMLLAAGLVVDNELGVPGKSLL